MNFSTLSKSIATALMFFNLSLTAQEVQWYKSNSGGMAFNKLSGLAVRRNEWALEVINYTDLEAMPYDIPSGSLLSSELDFKNLEIQNLYNNGEKTKTIALYLSENNEIVCQQQWESNRESIEYYSPDGKKAEEIQKTENAHITKTLYIWQGDNLAAMSHFTVEEDGTDSLDWTDTYYYLRDGSLREIQRQEGESTHTLIRMFNRPAKPKELELFNKDGSSTTIAYDEDSRELSRYYRPSIDKNRELSQSLNWLAFLPEEDGYHSEKNINLLDRTETVHLYDREGRLVEKNVFDKEGEVLERYKNIWDSNGLVYASKEVGEDVYEQEFEYTEPGVIAQETNKLNGIIQRIFIQEGGNSREKLYNKGDLLLEVYYQNGEKILEKRYHEKELYR